MRPEPMLQVDTARGNSRGSRIASWIALSGLILLGYFVFALFARGIFRVESVAVLAVASVAGIASFFSPCAFPFLPSYLGVRALVARDAAHKNLVGAIADGAVAGLGVVGFNVVLGSAVGLVGAGFANSLALLSPTPSPTTVIVRLVVAGAIVFLGLLRVFERGFHARIVARVAGAFQRVTRGRQGTLALFLYGFSYTAVGIGCTGPFLASVVLIALAAGGFAAALLAFLVFSFTMAALMMAVSLLAFARGVARMPGEGTRRVQRIAGAALVAFGALLALFTVNPYLLRPLFP